MEINVGKGITIDVDAQKLDLVGADGEEYRHDTVPGHVIYIGLRNILMDAHAGIATDEPDYQAKARAVVEKKLAAMYAGEVRVAGTREGDPVRAEAMRLALAQVDAMLRKAGRKPSKVEAKAKREAAQKLITPELLETAKARVEQAKATIADDADLSELGL
jgi:hypothetical protein